MTDWKIRGGRNLAGEVRISGAKNATLPILFATLLTGELCEIHGVPEISDVDTALDMLKKAGATVERDGKVCRINTKSATLMPKMKEAERMRAALYFLGASLGRFHRGEIGGVGGCNFGSRPFDLHLDAFQKFGAKKEERGDTVVLSAKDLHGASVVFPKISVGATINSILVAVMCPGTSELFHVAKEPHVVDTVHFLNCCGAEIIGAGTDHITVYGGKKLHGCRYTVIPDMIETGTFLCAMAACGGRIVVKNAPVESLQNTVYVLKRMGVGIELGKESIMVEMEGKLQGIPKLITAPYPGFPTDMQPQFGVLLSLAKGGGTIQENIFSERFQYVEELRKMGVTAKIGKSSVHFLGDSRLKGCEVFAPDLRASAALTVAGLAASGSTLLHGQGYLERGYENFPKKLANLGADISPVNFSLSDFGTAEPTADSAKKNKTQIEQ